MDEPHRQADAAAAAAHATRDAPAHQPPSEPEDLQKLVSSLPVDHAGTTVYVKGWRREHSERHPIVIVHDLGEHTELYREAALAFTREGYSVYIFDLRGHGRSGRRLGHAPSFNILVKDLLQVAAWVRHKEKGRAPIILGHGIGALISIEFTKLYGNFCKAAILSAPSRELTHEVSLFARIVIRVLAEISPTFRIPAALSPRFAKDLRVEQMDDEDGSKVAYFPRLSAIFAQELLGAIKRTEATFIKYHGSVLILCPGKDTICSYAALKKSAALHDENNLLLAELPTVGHSVFTEDEPERSAAMSVILPWLDSVLRARPKDDVKVNGASKSVRTKPMLDAEKPGATKL